MKAPIKKHLKGKAPLVGGTEVLVKLDGSWQVRTVRELLSIKTSFKVITWTGRIFKTAEAYASYEGDTQEIYRIKVAGYTHECTPDHPWPILKRGVTSMVAAKDLKTGFEIVRNPGLKELTAINAAKLANIAKPAVGHIVSVKRKTKNEWVGCLTVPNHHNFMLASGMMTGNCTF